VEQPQDPARLGQPGPEHASDLARGPGDENRRHETRTYRTCPPAAERGHRGRPSWAPAAAADPAGALTGLMVTPDELRRTLGPLGIWMPPPSSIGIEPESYARQIEAAGFTSVWYPGMNSAADIAAVEPALAATERLVLGTGIASVWTWPPADLA